MKVNRKDLLHKLLCVEPGISKKKSIQQSSCVVLRRGRFYTLSQEIACSLVSDLEPSMEGAIGAEKLIEVLKELPEEELELWIESNILCLKGVGRKIRIPMEEEVKLPVDDVERPKEWVKLSGDFEEAVDLSHRCTSKAKGTDFTKQCVHIHPKWLEACDDTRMIRYPLRTFVKESVLVRGESIKAIVQLGMTRGCETPNWLHFYNPMGLRLSIKKFALESYPPLEQFLNLRGQKVVFPKGLERAAKLAGIFADEDRGILVKVSKDEVVIEGKSFCGEYDEQTEIKYRGPEISFFVSPKLIATLIEKHSECEVTESSLRVNGGKYILATCLEMKQ